MFSFIFVTLKDKSSRSSVPLVTLFLYSHGGSRANNRDNETQVICHQSKRDQLSNKNSSYQVYTNSRLTWAASSKHWTQQGPEFCSVCTCVCAWVWFRITNELDAQQRTLPQVFSENSLCFEYAAHILIGPVMLRLGRNNLMPHTDPAPSLYATA